MSETSRRTVGRRRLLQTSALALAGGAALGGGAGPVAARSESGTDLTEWFGNVSNVDGVVDETGASSVTLTVGASGNNGSFAFDPAAVRVDPGTTVAWEWTGEGGQHNVVAAGDSEGAFESDLYEASGETFERTFESEGVYTYVCVPHEQMGMKGAVIVGDQEVTVPSGGGGDGGGGGGSGSGGDGEERTYLSREPDYDGWFDDADNYEGTVDARGREEVRITVGAAGNGGDLAFDPPAVAVDPGTRVIWEWAGDDGPHRFVAADGDYESPEQDTGQYGLQFDGVGISRFVCEPHRDAGMKGAVVVGDPYETVYDIGTSELLVGGTFAAGLLSPLGFAAAVWLRERLGGAGDADAGDDADRGRVAD